MDLIFLAFGTIILFFSGDILIRAAVDISFKMAVSPMVVGLTIIAFGTSAPELLVGLQATWNGFEGLALGNIIGSNIANILLILGMPALIMVVRGSNNELIKNYYFLLLASLLFTTFLILGQIKFWHGVILLLFLVLFIVQAIFYSNNEKERLISSELVQASGSLKSWVLGIFLVTGFVGLPLGASIVIKSATSIAETIGVSDELIGLTVVAIGTSLPELATSIAAAYRRELNLLLGNVIGSNMFNILGIAGLASLISPLELTGKIEILSLTTFLTSSLILAPFIIFKRSINRPIGLLFLAMYLIYILLLFK